MNHKKPTVIQFPINNICNSRCQMCDIWKQEKGYELSPQDTKNILSDTLFDEVVGIGLNGGEPTLRKDLATLGRSVIDSLPSLKNISLITNGLSENLVKKRVSELYDVCRDKGVHLDIMLSIDGVDEIHDLVRGRINNFQHTVNSLNYLRDNKIGDSYRIGCTLISSNIEDAERLMLWSQENDIYTRFRVGIPHKRLYSENKSDPFVLTQKQLFHLCNFIETLISRYESETSRKIFLTNLLNQLAYGLPRANGCYWKDQGVTLLSDGNLAYCAVESPNLANLLDKENVPNDIYKQNLVIRDNIVNTKCDTCLHDYEGPFLRKRDKLNLKINNYKLTKPQLYSGIQKTIILATHAKERLVIASSKISNTTNKIIKTSGNMGNKVLILGWYGTETLGDKAILYGIIDGILEQGVLPENIFVASINQYVTTYTLSENPATRNCTSLNLTESWALINNSSCKCVIFGGGPLMTSINYMVDYAAMFVQAKKKGASCLLWGNGIGPINSNKIENVRLEALKLLLKVSDLAIFRDKQSLDHALKLVPTLSTSKLSYGMDPAYHWVRKTSVTNTLSAKGLDNSKIEELSIGFAIRELPIREYFSTISDGESLKNSFNSAIRNVILSQSMSTKVYLQCMHRLPCGGDDRFYYNALLGDKINKESIYFSFEHRNPIEDIISLSRQSVLYAMRYHSVVFGLALRIPIIPIDYTSGGKIAYLCESLGLATSSIEQFIEISNNQKLSNLVSTLALNPEVYTSRLLELENRSLSQYSIFAGQFSSFYHN